MSGRRSDLPLATVALLAWTVFAPPLSAQDSAQAPPPKPKQETAGQSAQGQATTPTSAAASAKTALSRETTVSSAKDEGTTAPATRQTVTNVAPSMPDGAKAASSPDNKFILVVHAKNELDELDTSRISKMFLKKVRRWTDSDKTPVEPVDQAQDSTVREEFTQVIHVNKDLFAIKTYWQRMIFSGRMAPPPELRSDEEILAFVRSRRGAIGYVSRNATLGEGVKELKISLEEK